MHQQMSQPVPAVVWGGPKKSDTGDATMMPYTFAPPSEFSSTRASPATPSIVGPHFTPKKRGRPPKALPYIDLEFNEGRKSEDGKDSGRSTNTTSTNSHSNYDPLDDPKADDVFIGAYLLSQLCTRSVPTCVNCHTRRTPLWRKGWRDGILKRDVLLCNACGLKYSKRQYCCYCKFIYNMKEDVLSQQSNWMDCDSCRRWVHIDCELKYGNTFTFDGKKYHGPAKYFCPDCQQEQKLQPQLQMQPVLLPKPQQQTPTHQHPIQPLQHHQAQQPKMPQQQPTYFTLPLPPLTGRPMSSIPSLSTQLPPPTPQQPALNFSAPPRLPLPNFGFSAHPNNLPGHPQSLPSPFGNFPMPSIGSFGPPQPSSSFLPPTVPSAPHGNSDPMTF